MTRVQPSLSYAVAYGSLFEDFIIHASQLGFSSVQLIPDQSPNLYSELSPSRLRSLRELQRDLGMSYHLHNVFYDINLTSLVPEVKQCAFDITSKVLSIAQEINAQTVTLHPGYMFGGWRRDPIQRKRFWEEAEQSMKRLGSMSEAAKVPLLIENGSYHITTADLGHADESNLR